MEKTKNEVRFEAYLTFELSYHTKQIEEFKQKIAESNPYVLTERLKWCSEAVVESAHSAYILDIIQKTYNNEGLEKAVQTINYWSSRILDNLKTLSVMNSTGIFFNAVELTRLKAESGLLEKLDHLKKSARSEN